MCIKIVTVINKLDIFNKVIKENEFIKDFDLTVFDNTQENAGIPERYNSFINNNIKPDSDFWVIFCHQDFGFYENPLPILHKLDKNFIYGPIGIGVKKGVFLRHSKLITSKRILYGEFDQGNDNFEFTKYGKYLKKTKIVETIDCCCIIIHSSLIKKYNLKFDENLNFHMYVEDFCINAKKYYKIKTKAVQIKCIHLGKGTLNQEFTESANYVKTKYNIKKINSTCID